MIIPNKKPPEFSSDWSRQIRTIWPNYVFPLLKRQEPLNWLELGSFEGRSALWTVENMFLHPDSRITCVDVWQTWSVFQDKTNYSYESVFDSNTSGIPQIVKRRGTAREVLPTLPPRSFHGCYIDTSHEEDDTLAEARLAMPLMLPGAMIIFDDYEWSEGPGVKNAVDRLRDEWSQVAQLRYLGYQAIFRVSPSPNAPV